jgi:hypothetical protein
MNKIKKFLNDDTKMKNIEAIFWFDIIINIIVKDQDSRSSFLKFYYLVLQPLLYLNYKYLFNSIDNISSLRTLLFSIILRKKYKIQIEDYLEKNVENIGEGVKDIELIKELSNRNYDISKTDLVSTIYFYIEYILQYIFSIYYIQKYVPQEKHKFIFLRPTILIFGTLIEYVTIRLDKGKWYSFLRTNENKRYFHFTKEGVNASNFDKSYFFTAIVIEPVVTYYLVKAYSKWIKS